MHDLAFATSILIGPQRQTALLAKQAAEVDLLCGGRFRLGLGIGWNKLEYDALGVPFEERDGDSGRAGPRVAGPVDRAERHRRRALPPHPGVRAGPAAGATADSRSGSAGTPRPRCAASGASPTAGSPWSGRAAGSTPRSSTYREGAAEAGRDLSNFEFEGRLEYSVRDHDRIAEHARRWQAAGATHLSLNTMHAGLPDTDAHIAALGEMAEILL